MWENMHKNVSAEFSLEGVHNNNQSFFGLTISRRSVSVLEAKSI
jgi:hypothetical protein